MVKPVSLSDKAFAALREEKVRGESDSDVVLRLLAYKQEREKDPMHFVRTISETKMSMSAEEHLRWIRQMRDASAYDPWKEAEHGRGGNA